MVFPLASQSSHVVPFHQLHRRPVHEDQLVSGGEGQALGV